MSGGKAHDTTNQFMVGGFGEFVTVLRFSTQITRKEALNLAAWLVAIADRDDEFSDLLEAVRST